eukprot:jgi/Undpi1/9743/HiC_scaffold_27.g12199.m1
MTLPVPGLDHLSDESIFNFCSSIIALPWLVLVFAPKWNMRPAVVHTVALIQSAIYVMTFVASSSTTEGGFFGTFQQFSTLDGVVNLFRNPAVVLPAWVHYFAFDVIVGNYLVDKNLASPAPIPQVVMFLVLFFTFISGPAGFLLFTILSSVYPLVGPKTTTKAA